MKKLSVLLVNVGITVGISGLGCLISQPALALTIANGGFEVPSVAPGSFQNFNAGDDIGGWTAIGTTVSLVEKNYSELAFNGVSSFVPQEGNNSLDLTGPFNQGTSNGVQQQISTVLGQAYRLSFFVGVASGNSRNNYSVPSIVDVSIDGNPQGSFTNSALVPGTVNWQKFFLDFTASDANTTLTFLNGIDSSNNNFVGLDNVQIEAVPTPAPLLGLLGMGIAAIRKRKQEPEIEA
ncbi:MAG: PTPA-CTERM sorting domain-containing protein [Cyanobacteria bacterium J06650_10]